MNKKYMLLASALGLVACSETSDSSLMSSQREMAKGEMVTVSATAAKTHVSNYRHSMVNSWSLSSKSGDTVIVPVDTLFKNAGFAVNADFVVNDEGVYTIASAGVDGEAFAWMLQVEDGAIVFSWRAKASDEWHVFKSEKCVEKGVSTNIRVELAGDMVVFSIDGIVVGGFKFEDVLDAIMGSFTIGFDLDDLNECHCHNGQVNQVDLEKVDTLKTVDTKAPDSTSDAKKQDEWIAHWDFNDSTNVGKDVSGNGHEAKLVDGKVASVDGLAEFDGQSGFIVDLDKDLAINEFVVEARVKPANFSTMQNIIVAEPPGRYGDGWMLRIDGGNLTVHFRDEEIDGTEWNVFTGNKLLLDEWNEIRVERSKDSFQVFQNGKITISGTYKGDVSQMTYNWGIGYDAMMQNYHDRGFDGEIDYIRFGEFTGFSEGAQTFSMETPLVAWEFNEPNFVGLDRVANNTTHSLDGNPFIEDTTLTLDGKSGLYVELTRTFQRNEFSVETRVKPTAFAPMQNIMAVEPPGRYGDGWVIRVDDGVLVAQFRDAETDSTNWNVFKGEKLELNKWNDIRVVRTADSVMVFQNGVQTVAGAYAGDVSQLQYDIGIGYDAMNQLNNDRNFVGEIDYIRYYGK